MRKRITALALSLAMLCSTVPALAVESTAEPVPDPAQQAAEALYELGLFNGTGTNEDGTPIFELDRTPNRQEAITMLVRLLGKEEEAKAGTWSTPFTDLAEWATPYVGYAYTNGLTNGTSETTFGSTDLVSVSQYLTFVLRALGYEDGTDFQWYEAWVKSDELGLTSGQYSAETTDFTRGDVAVISSQALNCKLKGSTTRLQDTFPVKITGIQLSQNTLELKTSETAQLTAEITPDNATDQAIIWQSSDPTIVTVTEGTVCALNPGTATITATTSNGLSDICTVTVSAAPIVATDIQLDKTSLELESGDVARLIDTVIPNDTTDQTVAWKSSNTSVATVDDGKITAVAPGTASITATTSNGLTATCTVAVSAKIQWYSEGEYRIGTDLPAGEYYLKCTRDGYSGYYCIYTNTKKDKIVDNDNFDNYSFIKVQSGQLLKLSRCKIASTDFFTNSVAVQENGYYVAGSYRVGIDIPAGEYQFTPTKNDYSGYYCAYSDITKTDIVDNDLFDGNSYYSVSNGQILKVSRAKFTLIKEAVEENTGGSLENSTSSSSSNHTNISTTKDVNDLVNYISTHGTKNGGTYYGIRQTRTSKGTDMTARIIYYHRTEELGFLFDYDNGSQSVSFTYDIATQSVDKIHVAGVGSGVNLLASCHADFDISTYTSTTSLNFTKDSDDFSLVTYATNYEELCNLLVQMAVPAFGLLLVDTAGMTLADIGFSSY